MSRIKVNAIDVGNSSRVAPLVMSVSMNPGAMTLTRTLREPSSFDKDLEKPGVREGEGSDFAAIMQTSEIWDCKPITPALEALYMV